MPICSEPGGRSAAAREVQREPSAEAIARLRRRLARFGHAAFRSDPVQFAEGDFLPAWIASTSRGNSGKGYSRDE
jgi:hypothetical protein